MIKYLVAIVLISGSSMAQVALHGDASDYNRTIDEKCFGGCHSKSAAVRELPKHHNVHECMVDLAEIKDPELRNWCVEQSKRLP